jgi:hypothetical protein
VSSAPPSTKRRFPLALALFAALRTLAVFDLKPARFGDSASYFHLSFLGHAPRLWTAPLLFKVFPDDASRVAAQVFIGIACWWYLAATVAAELRDARARIAAYVVVGGFGLTLGVTSWDLTILSDSLSISLTVLLVAVWWRELLHPTRWTAPAVVVVGALWVFTRQSDVVVNHVIVVMAAVSVVWARPRWRRATIALALLTVSLWGQYNLRGDHYVTRVNINAIVIDRIEPVPGYLRWWADHGLPRVPKSYAEVEPTSPQYRPAYVHWLDQHGEGTYGLFLLTHPGYTLVSPWRDLLPVTYGQLENRREPSILGFGEHYGAARAVVPGIVASALVDPGSAGLLLVLAVVAGAGIVVTRRRHGYDRRWTLPLVVLAVNIPHVLIVWHGSTAELGRHSLALSVSTRLALWALVLLVGDRWLTDRAQSSLALTS